MTGIHVDYHIRAKERLATVFERIGATNIVWLEHPKMHNATVNLDVETPAQIGELVLAGLTPQLGRCNIDYGI